MSYTPSTDLLSLLRQTAGGVRASRMPGLDYVLSALARAGLFTLFVGPTAPIANQANTVWLLPASPSWSAEGTVFLWNSSTSEYELATPVLWSVLLSTQAIRNVVVQDITAPGPANINAHTDIVRVNQLVGAPITLIMPLSTLSNGTLVSDWKGDAGTHNITVELSGSDIFPGGLTTWTIAADTGSVFFRPVPGGYVV